MILTAAEARELAGPNAQERVESVMPQIRAVAMGNGPNPGERRRIRLGNWWGNGAKTNSQEWQEAKTILEGLGYQVSAQLTPQDVSVTQIEW